jgi:pimeloyl-ACP methyl ester carboxylesterase
VKAFVTEHGPARAIIAHSLGAKASALAVSRGAAVERLVFLAPMGDFAWYLDIFADRHGFGRRVRDGLRRRLDRRLGVPLFDTDIAHVTTTIDDPPPLLVIHDPEDPDSPYRMSERLVQVWPGARLVTTRGLGRLAHYRILRHRPAINAALEFIGEPPETESACAADGSGISVEQASPQS